MESPETHVYKVAGSCRIKVDVYRPPAGQSPAAAVLWLHGGGLIWGTRRWISKVQLRRYLERGFTVFAPDYRLAPESKLPAIVEDLADAWRWVREEGPSLCGIDRERVGVVGHSAGGYLTLTAGLLTPAPRALVSFYGYGDIVAGWYTMADDYYSQLPAVSREQALAAVGSKPIAASASNKRFTFYLYCRQQGLWPQEVGGQDPATDPAFFDPYCPVRHVGPGYPPTLLLHGDADTDVPHEQSRLMAEALARAGVEQRLITVDGGGHGFDGRLSEPKAGRAFAATLDFLSGHLQA
ncbi:MAG: alpha/beta hydrolase [Anaerolineae bacterium]